ncbi:MAG: TolB-like 6-bladed beta-propeller domain-containing protein [Ignavibacteriaceae bacterium]|nr:TolB-like 6-bladed beta-propeller domain-containing protein [Ignavibacteriaceae bacterium]
MDEEEAILGYLDIRVTDSLIIALFSGELVATAQYETNIIQVFNLEGKLLKTVTLDIKISQIEIDENNNRLIAVSYYPTPIVYAFNLEKILH